MRTGNGLVLPGCSRGFPINDGKFSGFERLFGSRRSHITLSDDDYVEEAACGFRTL